MEKKVESRKQSGGITAENVNITHNHKHVTINKKKKNNILKTIAALITIAVGLITIFTYISSQHGKPPYTNDKGNQIKPTHIINNH